MKASILTRIRLGLLPSGLLIAATSLSGQNWTNIPSYATTLFSYNGATSMQEAGWTWYMGFPASNYGVEDLSCPAGHSPDIPHWYSKSYLDSSKSSAVWKSLDSTTLQPHPLFFRFPGSVYRTGYYPHIQGIAFQGAFEGKLVSNNDTTWNNVVQTVFYHQEFCYAGGPEFGFYRILTNPDRMADQNTVHFYYSINSNCGGATTLPVYDMDGKEVSSGYYTSNCNSVQISQGSSPIVQMSNDTTINLWFNSTGTLVYNYSAYLYTSSCDDGTAQNGRYFLVSIQDPTSGAYAYRRCVPAGSFTPGGGYVTMGIQKSLALDVFNNPLGDVQSTIWDSAAVGINQLWIAPLPPCSDERLTPLCGPHRVR